jgi:glucose-1-phosphate adenylyltransferase
LDNTLTLILAGGRGRRLQPLTDRRAKPVVPFAHRHLIDYTLENCVRSGLREVVVLTQHLCSTVSAHIDRHWRGRIPGLTVLCSEKVGRPYRGTADAVRAALAEYPEGQRVLVLGGDHVYDMDYRDLATDHRARQADATIGIVPVPCRQAGNFGCVRLDANRIIQEFVEKPAVAPITPDWPGRSLASMGIYLFRRSRLEDALYEHPDAHDFGHEIIPAMLHAGDRIAGHLFVEDGSERYWRDISDVDAYHATHLDLLHETLEEGDSWVGPRSVVAGGTLKRSVVGRAVQVGPHATVTESILFDDVIVGPGASLRRVVVEQGVRIPADARIGFDREADREWGTVTAGGVVVISKQRAEVALPPIENTAEPALTAESKKKRAG